MRRIAVITPSLRRDTRSPLHRATSRSSCIRSASSLPACSCCVSSSSNSNDDYFFAKNNSECRHQSIPTRQRRFSSSLLPAAPSNKSLPLQNNIQDEEEEDPNAHYFEPIDFTTASQISGEESQILEVQLRPNQMLRAESGAMIYMTEGVNMETSMGSLGGKNKKNGNSNNSDGFSAGLTRMMTGQNLMVSDFQYTSPTDRTESESSSHQEDYDYGTVGLGTDFPAKILKFNMREYPESKLVCQKGAFLAGSYSIAMEMAYTKSFTSGFFGGEGFILQSLQGTTTTTTARDHDTSQGEETAFLKAYGTVIKKELKPGETIRASSGSLVCMTSTIDYDVATMPGFKNVMFGGEGLFVTTLTGPGTIWLQGMPVDRMVSEIARKVPSGGGGIGLGIPIMGGGGGGEGEGASDAADGAAEAASGGDAGVPLTDAAVDADRNATVASSGMTSSADPDSSESLFGDAAYGGGNASSPMSEEPSSSITSSEDSTFSSDQFSQPDTNMPEFEEPTMVDEQQFEDDGTTFSTYEDGGGDSTGGEGSAEMPTPDDEEGSSLFGQLWDMFRDFTDED